VTETELHEPDTAAAATPPAVETGAPPPVFVIRPASRRPHLDVSELWHYRELLATFVWRDVVVRYKQTFLGVAWALLVPVFTAVIYIVIFGRFAKFPSGNMPYPILVFSGLLPMQYFTSSLTGSSTSLIQNINLVTKVYFPRVLLPLSAAIVPVVDFLIGLSVLLVLMFHYGTWPGGVALLLAPAFIALAFVTALGFGFFLSAVNVRYRDVPYVIPVFLSVLPFVSGVPYAVADIPSHWQWILSFNPMTSVISGWRWAVLGANPPVPGQVAVGVAVGVVLFLGGLAFFRSSEPRFADTI
jgi:lipopolysaccharide transport system permease protein